MHVYIFKKKNSIFVIHLTKPITFNKKVKLNVNSDYIAKLFFCIVDSF